MPPVRKASLNAGNNLKRSSAIYLPVLKSAFFKRLTGWIIRIFDLKRCFIVESAEIAMPYKGVDCTVGEHKKDYICQIVDFASNQTVSLHPSFDKT